MARNLSRNTQLFISTLAPGSISVGNCIGDQTGANLGDNNTWKINVLDGYSFSQDTNNQEIGISEAASECIGIGGLSRGTLTFNTSLNPVDVSFSTYVRPYDTSGTLGGDGPACVELPLWAAALGTKTSLNASPGAASSATFNTATGTTDTLTFTTEQSDVNELMTVYLYFKLENTTYVVSNFSVNSAEVDFSIDGIAMINWSGSGTTVLEDPAAHAAIEGLGAGVDYVDVPTTTSTSFLRNKLSTLELVDSTALSTPIIDNTDGTGAAYVEATGVVRLHATSGDMASLTAAQIADLNAGGRLHNVTLNEWAQVVSVTQGNDEVLIHPADRALVAGWDLLVGTPDVLDLYGASQYSAVSYCIPITGGTLSLENNMSYLTPEELAIVNQPLAGFTGNRSISGSFTAYLNTGAMGTGGLLQDLLAKANEVSNDFALTLHMGGGTADAPRVDFTIPHAQISIPTTNVEDVISTEISFNAKSWNAVLDEQTFEGANEMTITYVTQQA